MQRSLAFAFALLVFAPLVHAAEPRVADSLQPFVEKGTLAGAVVLVANADKVLTVETVGYADRENKIEMKADNIFWIASMTKPITAAALMILVDEGKVALDDPIEKYIPEFKGAWVIAEQDKTHQLLKKPKRAPTIRDILRHTAGLPFVGAMEKPTPATIAIDVLSIRDSVRSYAMEPLLFEPGTKYAYSNAGTKTVGRIIEVASGMRYEDFMAKRLFAPLGMTESIFMPTSEQLKRVPKSYRPGKDGKSLEPLEIALLSPLTGATRHPCPGGGLFSTAKDIAAFGQMILRGGMHGDKRILSEAAIRELTGTQTSELTKGSEAGYGLCFATTRKAKADGPAVAGPCGHGGAYATHLAIDPDKKLVMIYMVQHAGFHGDGAQARPAFEKAAAALYAK